MLYSLYMSSPIRLTREEIKKLVYGLKSSLNEDQRTLIRETLENLAHSSDSHISPEELHKALRRLHEDHRLSKFEVDAVTRAVFP